MTITYRNAFRDRLAFAAYHLPRKPLGWLISAGTILFFTFESVLPAVRAAPPNTSLAVRVIGFIFLELLLVLFLLACWTVITVITMISSKNKPLNCQRSLTVSDDLFVTDSEYGRSETKWNLVQKLGRTRSHIFLYLSAESAVIVPRRAFESTAQWDAFYDVCRRGTARASGR